MGAAWPTPVGARTRRASHFVLQACGRARTRRRLALGTSRQGAGRQAALRCRGTGAAARLRLEPSQSVLHVALAEVLVQQNKADAAIEACQRALALDPDNIAAAVAEALILPPVYAGIADLRMWRNRFAEGLGRLHARKSRWLAQPHGVLRIDMANFYLAYQGEDDRALQSSYSDFLAALLGAAVPELEAPLEARSDGAGKIRICFISSATCAPPRSATISGAGSRICRAIASTYALCSREVCPIRMPKRSRAPATNRSRSPVPSNRSHGLRDRWRSIFWCFPTWGWLFTAVCSPICVWPGSSARRGATPSPRAAASSTISCRAPTWSLRTPPRITARNWCCCRVGTRYVSMAPVEKPGRDRFGLPPDKRIYLCPQLLHKVHPDNDALCSSRRSPATRMPCWSSSPA